MLNKDICVDVLDTILVVFCWGFVSFVRSPPAALVARLKSPQHHTSSRGA